MTRVPSGDDLSPIESLYLKVHDHQQQGNDTITLSVPTLYSNTSYVWFGGRSGGGKGLHPRIDPQDERWTVATFKCADILAYLDTLNYMANRAEDIYDANI